MLRFRTLRKRYCQNHLEFFGTCFPCQVLGHVRVEGKIIVDPPVDLYQSCVFLHNFFRLIFVFIRYVLRIHTLLFQCVVHKIALLETS